MSLLFTNTYDQALMAKVIAEAQNAAQKEGGFIGRTSVQKLLYFLKILGVPMGYRFRLHHYGPFCAEIMSDVDSLVADEVIRDTASSDAHYSNYIQSINYNELVDKYEGKLREHLEIISAVANAFATFPPEELELLTTIDFLYRSKKATGHQGPFKEFVLKKLKDVKKGKFTDEKSTNYYDLMVKINLIEP